MSAAATPETRRERRRRERLEEQDAVIPAELYGLRRGTVPLLTVLAFLFALFTLIPIAWIAINSTKNQANIFESFGFWFSGPFEFFHNFSLLFHDVDGYGTYIQWFGNTALYAVLGGVGATTLSAFAGYGFARFRFRGSRVLFGLAIAALLVPITALTLPLYLTYAKAHLINSIWGMVLPSMVSPIGVYLMRVYVDISVPRELIDAARVDGAGEARIFFRVALPLMVPGLLTVLLISIVAVWNNYFLPLLIFNVNTKYPLTVGLGLWSNRAVNSGDANLYPMLVIGGLVTIIPLIVLFLILQRHWRGGLLLGSIANLSEALLAAISLRGLTKVFAVGTKAVDGLDLDVDDGEFVVLVGPSGCGKTTALRMVAGLEMITSGTISIGGRVVNDVSPRHRDVAMVFQNYALYPHLSVYQNIGFALENKKVPRAERDRRVRAAASVLGLSDLLGRKPRRLSGGQRQRVAMGRAIVREPSVFLMDEPLSNLDAQLRVQMRSEVLRVHRSVGATTLYVTHDQVEAMTMGDRVAVLRAGVLQQYGTPPELYDRPANIFVATFIGSPAMNLYEAALDSGAAGSAGSGPAVVVGSQRLALPGEAAARLGAYQGRKIIVGLRPEDLSVPPQASEGVSEGVSEPGAGRPGTLVALVADVRMVEVLGSELHAYFSVDATPIDGSGESASEAILAGSAPNGVARLDPRAAVRAGTRATFAVNTARLHFFDPDTGNAIG